MAADRCAQCGALLALVGIRHRCVDRAQLPPARKRKDTVEPIVKEKHKPKKGQ